MPAVADWTMYHERRDIVHALPGLRIDQKYCSNACRQKAYRARKSAIADTPKPSWTGKTL